MSSAVMKLSSGSVSQPSSAAGSPASLTALQENVRHLVMTVTSQENLKESFGRLNPDGSLLRMSRGSAQASLDGSLESSCMTFPKWGIVSGGVAGELLTLEPVTKGNGCLLLPTPTTPRPHDNEESAGKYLKSQNQKDLTWAIAKLLPTCTSRDHKGGTVERVEDGNPKRALDCEMRVHGLKLQPAFAEWMMGVPEGWTALDASEMPSSRNKSIRSSKPSQMLKKERKNS